MIIFLPQVFTEAQLQATLGKLRQSLERVPADSTDKLESFLKVASSPGSSCTVLYCTVLYCTLLYFTVLQVASKILHPNHCLLVEVKQRLLALYGSALAPATIGRKLELAEQVR